MGWNTYLGTYGYFPAGGVSWVDAPNYVTSGLPADGSAQFGGWGFRILPFIEGTAAYNGGGGATTDQCTINVIGAINKLFFCPLRRQPMAISGPSWYGPSGTYAHALCDYAASNWDETGILAYGNTGLVPASVIDGFSNTLMLGDKRMDLTFLGTFQGDDNEGFSTGWDDDTIRYTSLQPMPDTRNGSGYGDLHFGSSDPNGFNAVFADGSVHILRYNIDLGLFQSLGNIADGAPDGGNY